MLEKVVVEVMFFSELLPQIFEPNQLNERDADVMCSITPGF